MRLVRCISLSMAFGPLIIGCGFRGGGAQPPAANPAQTAPETTPAGTGAAQAPVRLLYATDPVVCTKGAAITPNTPYSVGGPATAYQVSPPLPPGLALNPATGVISGTPTAVAATAGYEVTASNPAGSTSVTLTLTVNAPAPGAKPVVTLAPFFTANRSGLAASTQNQGADATYEWTLQGATLTAGQGTPAITFTAGSPGPMSASVTVATTGGTVSGSGEATVVPAPDATLTLPVALQTLDAKTAQVPDQPGMTIQWTIIPGSATASIVSGQGTSTVQFRAGAAAGSFQVQVKVKNQAGDELTASGTVKVQNLY